MTTVAIPAHRIELRLLHDPEARRRMARLAAVLAVVFYAVRASFQLALLDHESLRWDFLQFYNAAQDLNHGRSPYTGYLKLCPGQHWCLGGYIFPPLFAEALRPLALLPLHSAGRIWLLISHAFLLGAIFVVHRTIGTRLSTTSRNALLASSLLFFPLYQSLYFLQVGTLLLLLLALSAWGFANRSPIAGALPLAAAIAVKLLPAAIAPAFLRRDRRHLLTLLVLALGLGALFGVMGLLTPTTWQYLTEVLPRTAGGTPNLDNVSFPAILARVEFLTAIKAGTLEPLGLAVALAGIAVTWYRARVASDATTRCVVFASFVALVPIISTVTWNHHLITELLVFALLAPALQRGGAPLYLAIAAYPLLWIDRHFTDPLTAALGFADPSGWHLVPFLLLTDLNVIGMLLLWLSTLGALQRSSQRTR